MPDIAQGNNAKLILAPGEVYRVSAAGTATVQAVYGAPSGTTTVTAASRDFGPYDAHAKLIVTATSGPVNYQLRQGMSPVLVDDDNQLITPDGDVVGGGEGDGLNANTDDSATVSVARQIKASAGRVTSILCTAGSAITLTLYDNAAAAASGRQIYSGTLSAGDVVNPADAWFAHGCYASFTGTAAFVINTSESAE